MNKEKLKIAKNKDARTCYEKAINLKPDFVNAYFNLETYFKATNY